jgi:transcriptional regulator with GAF, ATPase, and Fis domain
MNVLKKYKILSYVLLALVIIVSFILTNLLLNLVIAGRVSGFTVVYIIVNLILNFGMFFIIFYLIQLLIEKETSLNELINQIQESKNELVESKTEVTEEKKLDIEEIIHQIIPASPQSFTIEKLSDKLLANISKVFEINQGLLYVKNKQSGEFIPTGKFAYYSNQPPKSFFEGDSLPGQVVKDKKILSITSIPEEYFVVVSGLGRSIPKNLMFIPVVEKDEAIGLIELASFKSFDKDMEKVFTKLSALLAKIIVKIK